MDINLQHHNQNQNGRHMVQHVFAMVTKVQKMLNGNRTADPFET
jgi:hypothetical protein